MSFNWEKFVVLAEKLHTQKSEECYRTAISRAYYGVFCILRDLKGYDKYTKGDVHSKIIEVYKKSNDSREKWIGKILDDLRNMRNTAD
ncbi:MAG TPA: DNA-binding protein, partial [Caldisericia bacterium]|nr:DNA-binding protein [Caldisericia bacterium]